MNVGPSDTLILTYTFSWDSTVSDPSRGQELWLEPQEISSWEAQASPEKDLILDKTEIEYNSIEFRKSTQMYKKYYYFLCLTLHEPSMWLIVQDRLKHGS